LRLDPIGSATPFLDDALGEPVGEPDYRAGYERGRASGTDLMFHLTIETPPLGEFAADPQHAAEATGWVHSDAMLGGRRAVQRGRFNLFVDTERPGEKRMHYRLHFGDGHGSPLTLVGHKVIADDPGFDLWPDTTTLFTRVVRGHTEPGEDDDAELIAAGILRITPLSFARQLTTFRARGDDFAGNLAALGRFNLLFLGALWQVYGKFLRRTQA
jgi:cholesterol oxidase